MSAREDILKQIADVKPVLIPLNVTSSAKENDYHDLIVKFSEILHGIGGEIEVIKNTSFISDYLSKIAESGNRVVNCVAEIGWSIGILADLNKATDYENVFIACIRGTLGVAENAAIWVDESDMGNRLLPFISQHLILIIYQQDFVANMHQAYKKIDTLKSGYGTFIAGPSKTADIEQSLVIGAHGPRSLKVFVIAA
jgi:L-lactate dehydrogenase complex protein LldG